MPPMPPVPGEAAAGAAYCHAVLARLVEEPGRPAPAVPDGLDLGRVRQVTGLITKVRHNPIRFRLPLTMRALAAAGVEIDFFADLAPEFGARRRAGLTDDERVALFLDALDRWLDPSDAAHRLVADVAAHERTMAEVAAHPPVPPPDTGAAVRADSRPRRRAGVRVLHLSVHPPDVADPPAGGLDRSPRCYAYVPTPAGPRVKRLDPALAPLLDLADGSATVEAIATGLGVGGATAGVAAVFEALVHRGLADVVAP